MNNKNEQLRCKKKDAEINQVDLFSEYSRFYTSDSRNESLFSGTVTSTVLRARSPGFDSWVEEFGVVCVLSTFQSNDSQSNCR